MAEHVVLRAGCARWLLCCHGAVGLIALWCLLAAGAGPAWTAGAVLALIGVHGLATRQMGSARLRGRLHLAEDGSVLLFTAGGVRAAHLATGGWCTGWLCVLPLEDSVSGRRLHCVLCRSLNRPDAYRKLLRRMRLQDSPGITWEPGQP